MNKSHLVGKAANQLLSQER